jgi:hypothetical protein
MFKSTMVAVTLAALLAGPALADDRSRRDGYDRVRGQHYSYRHDDRRYDHRRDDRYWRHVPPVHYRSNHGYRSGYESGWRDAAGYCRFDYRPGRWYRDPRDDYWFFGFQIDG